MIPMTFQTELTVAFNDIDAAGIVYFGTIFDYCHRAYEQLLKAIKIPLPQILKTEGWAMPLVHAEADYHMPMLHGELLTITVELVKTGTSSLHFQYIITGPEDQLRAKVLLIHAAVSTDDFKPAPLNVDFLEALKQQGLGVTL
jgi:YbgC/YbaW family acyl-CoA thioester hydrolase